MLRSAAGKVMWVGRATVFLVGLAVILALLFGVASSAGAHGGYKGLLHLGHSKAANATTTLINRGAGAALSLAVNPGQPPLAVNSSTKVTNLNADMLDDQDSTAFSPANHNHDPSYIQQSPLGAENASIHISGTMRTSGMLRTGSETGTSQSPGFDGLVVRRINSTSESVGHVVARTDQLRLERDGTSGGLRIAWDANTSIVNTVNCMGINSSGSAVNHYSSVGNPTSAGTTQIFTDAQNVVYATCSFGNSFQASHVTQVTLQRRSGDNWWVGTVISSFNQ